MFGAENRHEQNAIVYISTHIQIYFHMNDFNFSNFFLFIFSKTFLTPVWENTLYFALISMSLIVVWTLAAAW